MADLETDVAIIGAGTAGLAAERHARDAGAKTLLIDEAFAGTTCATVGCMPSKLLVAAGEVAETARRAGTFGIGLPEPDIDGPAVMTRVRALRDHFVTSTKKAFDALPDGVAVRARARFTGEASLELSDGRSVKARAIVIATGAKPVIPKPFRALGDALLTNETLFELADLPASVGVIGAGALGLEMAQALARLGVRVEVFDMGDTIAGLPVGKPESSLRTVLGKEFPIHLGIKPEARCREGAVEVSWECRDGAATARFERLLVAAGRDPNFDGLDLEASGVDLDDRGAPVFNARTMQCGAAPVFIAGDADDDRPVLHEASAEGTIAGQNAATFPDVREMRRKVSLQIMFTEPNMAVIGTRNDSDVTGSVDFANQGRAKVLAKNWGVCELHAEPGEGRLTGATMVGPGVEHLAHLVAWSIDCGATASEMLDRPFYHPTLEEGLKTALQEICAAVGAPKAPERDDGFLPGAE